MIKQLRKKFIIICMSLVSVVLTVVVSVCVFSAVRSYHFDCSDALAAEVRRSAEGDYQQHFPSSQEKHNREPKEKNNKYYSILSFTVALDNNGEYVLTTPMMSIDESVLENIIDGANGTEENDGYLKDYGVMFTKADSRICFISIINEHERLTKTVLLWVCSYIAAVAAFMIISVFLSRWALSPVEKSWKQQQQFIADASHEIKTPLTVILANTDIMSKELGDNKWLTGTRNEAVHMKSLVENMLFLARSDAAKPTIPDETVSLSDIAWECALGFEALAYEKSIVIESNIKPDCCLKGDSQLLRRLVSILLDNAVKYTPEGGKIFVRLEKTKRDRILLRVRNSGSLIPPEQLPRIFDRFYRVDDARTREEGGYGLGLAIAKEITNRHHGDIVASSNDEYGTEFSVSFQVLA